MPCLCSPDGITSHEIDIAVADVLPVALFWDGIGNPLRDTCFGSFRGPFWEPFLHFGGNVLGSILESILESVWGSVSLKVSPSREGETARVPPAGGGDGILSNPTAN